MGQNKKLIIVVGPTAVGKSDYAIDLALRCCSPVISCDSRQIYKEMTIGTAVPSASQLAAVKHYFIQTHTVRELYTAGNYELEALALIQRLFAQGHETLVMAGGSGFYVDAVRFGLDDLPPCDEKLRAQLTQRVRTEGVESLRMELRMLDRTSYESIDIANPQRVVRALEVCLLSGRPFSSFKLSKPKQRSFEIEMVGLSRPREELYSRINLRVEKMVQSGLVEEVRGLAPLRGLSALRTVGYAEIFDMLDGRLSLDEAVARIQLNTRHYAKKQLTYWRRDGTIKWIEL